jgi:integrase/recombinase XerD
LQAEIAEYLKTLNITNKEHALFYTQKNPKRGFTANTMASHIKNIYLKSGNFGCSSHTGRRTFATQIAAHAFFIFHVPNGIASFSGSNASFAARPFME